MSKTIFQKILFLLTISIIGFSLKAQTVFTEEASKSVLPRYSCMQLSSSTGYFPRIIVDKEAKKISLEHAGYEVLDVYQFHDTLLTSVDTLEVSAPKKEIFVDENLNSLVWEDVSTLTPLDKEQMDECLLSGNEEVDEILQMKPFKYGDKKGLLVVLKRETMLYDENKTAHMCVPFFYDEENCEYIEECGAIFWHNLERLYITEIIHNYFPVILALEENQQFGEGKGLRIIFNRIKNK